MKKSFFLVLLLSSCSIDYKKPTIIKPPEQFLEAGVTWSEAKPNANFDGGKWWKIYNDPYLNKLIDEFNRNNQSVISAEYAYKSALELITQARAAYFPTVNGTKAITRQTDPTNPSSNATNYISSNTSSFALTSSWQLDVFNRNKYTVGVQEATALGSKNNWIYTKLSSQTSLAQSYFGLRALDKVQKYLNLIVEKNLAGLKYEENRYKAGIDNELTYLGYKNSYQSSLQAMQNNIISRQQYQHAIAVLIGESPSSFVIEPNYETNLSSTTIPLILPSKLIERRPDVAQAENQVMQANAQIGVNKSAFFPQFNMVSTATWSNALHAGALFTMPQFIWSVGPQLSATLFDGGSRSAQVKSAEQTYLSQVAAYRNTVLSAFQSVEDQLVTIKYLNEQIKALQELVNSAQRSLKLTNNQYKQGIVDNYAVLTAEIALYNAIMGLVNTQSLEKSAEITLIKNLGGGWQQDDSKVDFRHLNKTIENLP